MIDYRIGDNKKKMIVLHHTGSVTTLDRMLAFFRRVDEKSIHYIVDKEGKVGRQVNENDIAFHAGVSSWGAWNDINPVSIGIEIISDGKTFTRNQQDAVVSLCREIMKRNSIPSSNVVRHADVALPGGRKWDVGPAFYLERWGSWHGFQSVLDMKIKKTDYEKEIEAATEWVKSEKLSNGQRPKDPITREELWVTLSRFLKLILKLIK